MSTLSFGKAIDDVLADADARRAQAERVERDCMDLHNALYDAIKRIKKLGGDYDDLLAVLTRTAAAEVDS